MPTARAGSTVMGGRVEPHRRGVGKGEGLGEVMSAGQSLRRQNYTFMAAITPPVASHSATHAMHYMRVVVAVVSAVALELATFATVSLLITGR